MTKHRCAWLNLQSAMYVKYHDLEWGVSVHNDNALFECLILEGAQAGLSWKTVLKKRENYRKCFDNFNPEIVSQYDDLKIEELLKNEGIIRNRLKVKSAIRNAKAFLEIKKEFGSFDKYIWSFVNYKVVDNKIKNMSEIPTKTSISEIISKDLKKRGMNFVGPTIMYAYMQAVGIINDHEIGCFRYREV